MNTTINGLVSAEHVRDLQRSAQRARVGRRDALTPTAVELRLVDAAESQIVRRLADLDDAPELDGQVLLALVDGDGVAGLSLSDRRVVANPFVANREVVALLRLRAEQLTAARSRRRLRRLPRLHLA